MSFETHFSPEILQLRPWDAALCRHSLPGLEQERRVRSQPRGIEAGMRASQRGPPSSFGPEQRSAILPTEHSLPLRLEHGAEEEHSPSSVHAHMQPVYTFTPGGPRFFSGTMGHLPEDSTVSSASQCCCESDLPPI